MAYKKKDTYIPEVDIIKSGVGEKIDILSDSVNNGLVTIGRSSKVQKVLNDAIAKKYLEKKKEIDDLKSQLSDDIDDDDFKDIVKKKKKKDKKKKKKNKDTFTESLLNAIPKDMADYMSSGKKKKKKKKDKLKGLVIKEKKPKIGPDGEVKKKEDGKSEVAQRFKEVEKITRENLQSIDETMNVVDARIKELLKSSDRVRGKDTALSNYIESKTSLISARQKAASDILANRAKVYDIEMKKEKSASSASASDNEIVARLFPGLALNGSIDKSLMKHIDENGKNKDGKKKKDKKKKKGGGYDYGDDEDLLKKREKELINAGLLDYNSYDKHIEYEGQFDVAIKKAFTTGEWKFIAIDKKGAMLDDVPKSMLPSKKAAQMKFDDEKDVAIDINTNRAYRVYSVPSF